MLNYKYLKNFLFSLLIFLFSISFVKAGRDLENVYPGAGFSTTNTPINEYALYISETIIKIGVLLAVLIIIISGAQYLFSFGKTAIVIEARNRIISSIFGLLILLSSFLILKIINLDFTILGIPRVDEVDPVTIDPPPDIDPFELPPEPFNSVITTEVPIGFLIRDIFEFDQFDPGEEIEPYQEKRRMERIKEIAQQIGTSSALLVSRNNQLINSLENCSCSLLVPKTVGIKNPACNNFIQIDTIIFGNSSAFMNLKNSYEKGVKELKELKEDIAKLEEAQKFMRETVSSTTAISLPEYLYFKEKYEDTIDLSYAQLFKAQKEYKSFASFYYTTTGNLKEEFSNIVKEEKKSNQYSWCQEVPVGDAIELSIAIGKKVSERLEKLLKLSYIMLTQTISLDNFALSYNDNICNNSHIPAVFNDPNSNQAKLTYNFPGLLKGPYDSIHLKNISRLMNHIREGETKASELCRIIYDRDLFYLYNWSYLFSPHPFWWAGPNSLYSNSWFPSNFSYFMNSYQNNGTFSNLNFQNYISAFTPLPTWLYNYFSLENKLYLYKDRHQEVSTFFANYPYITRPGGLITNITLNAKKQDICPFYSEMISFYSGLYENIGDILDYCSTNYYPNLNYANDPSGLLSSAIGCNTNFHIKNINTRNEKTITLGGIGGSHDYIEWYELPNCSGSISTSSIMLGKKETELLAETTYSYKIVTINYMYNPPIIMYTSGCLSYTSPNAFSGVFSTRKTISGTTATLHSTSPEVNWAGSTNPTTIGFKWYESNNCTGDENIISDNVPIYSSTKINSQINYSAQINNLSTSTIYSFKAFIERGTSTQNSPCEAFTTLDTIKDIPKEYITDEGIEDIIFFGSEEKYNIPLKNPPKKPLTFDNIGLLYIIDNIIPEFNIFLEEKIENPIQLCSPKISDCNLLSCQSSRGLANEIGLGLDDKCQRANTNSYNYYVYYVSGAQFSVDHTFPSCYNQCYLTTFFRGDLLYTSTSTATTTGSPTVATTTTSTSTANYLYPYYQKEFEGDKDNLKINPNYQKCLDNCFKHLKDKISITITENDINFYSCQK